VLDPAPANEGADPLAECVALGSAPGSLASPLFINVAGSGEEDDDREQEQAEQGEPCEGEDCPPETPFVADGPYDAVRGFGWLGAAEHGGKAAWMASVFPLGTHSLVNPWSDESAYGALVHPYLSWVEGLSGYRLDLPDGAYSVTLLLVEPSYPEPGLRSFDVASGGQVLVRDLDLAARAGQDEIAAVSIQVEASGGALELEMTGDAILSGLVVQPAQAGAPAAEVGPVSPLEPSELGLPIVDVTVEPEDLATIHLDPAARVEVPARVESGGEVATGTIRLRGQSTRYLSKRSFRIHFDSGTIDGRDRLKLLAEANEPTRLAQLLAYDLFERMGGLGSHARAVLLRINGKVYGVYDDIEHVGDDFLSTRGYGVGDRYRIRTANLCEGFGAPAELELSGYEKKEKKQEPDLALETLLSWLGSAAEHELDAGLSSRVDVDVLQIYLAAQQLFSNWEVADGGHYLAHDPDSGRFVLAPWDLNNGTWGQSWHSLGYNTLYEAGAEPGWWSYNCLWTRALSAPSFRQAYLQRLDQALASEFGQAMDDAIDQAHAAIAPAVAAEPWQHRRRYEAWFADAPSALHAFVEARRENLLEQLSAFSGLGETGLVIAEVAPGPDGFVELENRGSTSVDASSCWLSADPQQPMAMLLDDAGIMDPGARIAIGPGAVAPSSGGGFVGLSCESGEQGEEQEEEEVWLKRRSFLFYPAMSTGEAYVRSGASWAVGTPTPGAPPM